MRDPFLTDLNKVNDKEDFKETLRFANSGVKIKLSLISPSCFSASQLKLAMQWLMMASKEKSFLSPLHINAVPSPQWNLVGLSPPNKPPKLKYETL